MWRGRTKRFSRWVKRSEGETLLPRVTIGPYVIACFGFIILSMLMGDAVILWQFHVVRAHTERLNGIDQKLTALLRVRASLLVFHDRLEALAQSEDADRLAKEAGPLRTAVLQDAQQARSVLSLLPSNLQQDRSLLPTLLTIQNALPSELEAITGLAAVGDWRAVRARLANQVRPLESLASALVERVNQEAAEEQAEAVLNIRSVQRRAFVVVPMTAISLCVLTFLAMFWTVYQIRVRALERHQVEVRALNEQMIKTQEAERMRIAGELHDGVLQQITSLTLRLAKVKRQVPPDSEATATVTGLQQELIKIGTDSRSLCSQILHVIECPRPDFHRPRGCGRCGLGVRRGLRNRNGLLIKRHTRSRAHRFLVFDVSLHSLPSTPEHILAVFARAVAGFKCGKLCSPFRRRDATVKARPEQTVDCFLGKFEPIIDAPLVWRYGVLHQWRVPVLP